ncbi:MAG: hypothetical protein KDK36_05055, partial [Leptospiraceae bacterium]|nr:hypothetical protein [Leptospiraceae bacterium]
NCKSTVFKLNTEKEDNEIISEYKSEKCDKSESFHQWYALFGYYKIYGKTGKELIKNHSPGNTYKIDNRAEWWDIIISFVGPIMVTISKKTTVVTTCENVSLFYDSEYTYKVKLLTEKNEMREKSETDYYRKKDSLDTTVRAESYKVYLKNEKDFLEEMARKEKEIDDIMTKNKRKNFAVLLLKTGEIKMGNIKKVFRDNIIVDIDGKQEDISRYTVAKGKLYK